MDRTHEQFSRPAHNKPLHWLGFYSTLRHWQRNRRTRRQLALLNEQQLADAGISTAQREQELAKPFWRGEGRWAKLRMRAEPRPALPELPHMHLKKSLIAALLSLGLAGTACASSLVATTDTLGGALAGTVEVTSDATSSLRDMKAVVQARDDAASFVASAGEIRGAQLEAALQTIRQQLPEAQSASDLQLAEAILAL